MTSGIGAQPDQTMPAGPLPQQPQAANADPGFAAFAATTQADWQQQMRDAFLSSIGLGQLIQLCNLLNGLPFVENIRAIGDKLTNGATGSIPAGIGALIDPLITAISDFVHAFDNIDWTNPATIIPTLLRDAITACWNLFWAIVKWAIYVIDTITNLDALSGVRFLQGLSNWLELYKLKDAFNTLLNTWESLDFAGAPLVALPQAFMAFVTFLQAIIAWFWDVVTKVLGITLPGWFHWAELGAVWTTYRKALQGIDWTNIPAALLTFVTASIAALQGIGRWILDVFTSLIGSDGSIIHQMFAGPIAFLNQMITYFFGTSGLNLWQSALDFMTGLTGSTPIAALKSLYTQLQNLGDLFGNLTSGNLLGFLQTFFSNFNTNFSSLPTTLQSDLQSLFTAAAAALPAIFTTLFGDLSTATATSALQTFFGQLVTLFTSFTTALQGQLNTLFGQITWNNIVSALTGTATGTGGNAIIGDVTNALAHIPGGNIGSALLAGVIPVLDASKITTGTFGAGLIPNLAASIITSGTFGAGLIPTLDASKITTGTFPQSMLNITSIAASIVTGALALTNIPALPISQTTNLAGYLTNLSTLGTLSLSGLASGALPSGITLPGGQLTGNVAASLISGITTTEQNITDYIYQAIHGGTSVGNAISTIKTSLQAIPGGNLSGAGSIAASLLGALDASKITTGQFAQSFVTNLTSDLSARALQTDFAALMSNLGAGTGTLAAITSRFTHIVSTGLVDAVSSITGLPGYLTNLDTSGVFKDFTKIKDASNNLLSGYLAHHNTSGVIDAVSSITGLPGYLTNLDTTGVFKDFTKIKDAAGTNALSGYLTNLSTAGVLSGIAAVTGLSGYLGHLNTSGILDAVSSVTGLGGYLTNLTSGGVLALAGLAAGALPGGITLPGGQITGAASIPQSIVNLTSIAAGIVTGTLGMTQIPSLTSAWAGQLDSSRLLNVISSTLIPGLDATKIISGTFSNAMSPGLLPQSLWQTSTSSANNLVISPNFEDPTITRTTGIAAGGSGAYSTAQKRSGSYSYMVTCATTISGQTDIVFMSPTTVGGENSSTEASAIKVQPGQWFYFEVYVLAKSTNTTTTGNVNFGGFVGDSTGVNGLTPFTAAGTSMSGLSSSVWKKLAGWWQVPAGYDRIWPFIWMFGQNVANQVFYWDDIIIKEDTQAQMVTQQLFSGSSILSTVVPAVVPSLPSGWGQTVDGSVLAGAAGSIASALIAALDATKVTTGTFGIGRIPTSSLTKSNITDLGTTYSAAQQAGIYAQMSNRSTGPISVTANTAAYGISSYFDTTDHSDPNISVYTPTSQFQVYLAGTYRVDLCYFVNGATFSAVWNIAPCLFKNGSLFKYGHDAISFWSAATGGVTVRTIHSSFTVTLAVNDYLYAAIQANNVSGTISNVLTYDSTGTRAYFTITLVSQTVP